MKTTAIGRSQHATNWMTVALLTLFVMGFGVFANSRVDAQAGSFAGPLQEQSQSLEFPTICKELKNNPWLGWIHTDCRQSEHGELAELVIEPSDRNILSSGS